MKFTAVKADNKVYVDGRGFEVDCSELPEYIHAIQWDGERGNIEMVGMPNMDIASIKPFQYLIDRWTSAKDKFEAEEAAQAKYVEDTKAAMEKRAIEAKERSAVQQKIIAAQREHNLAVIERVRQELEAKNESRSPKS